MVGVGEGVVKPKLLKGSGPNDMGAAPYALTDQSIGP